MNKKETINLVLEVFTGIIFFTVITMIVAFVCFPEPAVFAGLFLGMVLSLCMFLSMTIVLSCLVKMKNHKLMQLGSIISAIIRYIIFFLLMIIVITRFSQQINPIATVIGVFGLKFGTILQPVIHKAIRGVKK